MRRPLDPESENQTPGQPASTAPGVPPVNDGQGKGTVRRALRRWFHTAMMAMMSRVMGPMITCRELVEFLWRYVEDDLTPEERKTFDRHLSMCRSCRAYLDSYRKTIELGQEAFTDLDAAVPDDVPDELVNGILAARRARG